MSMCRCGQVAGKSLYLSYCRPRENFEPMAHDPWNVHGSWPLPSCGSPACEAEGYAELLALHPDANVAVCTEPGAGIFGVLPSNRGPCPECPLHGDTLLVADPGAHDPDEAERLECEVPECGYGVAT